MTMKKLLLLFCFTGTQLQAQQQTEQNTEKTTVSQEQQQALEKAKEEVRKFRYRTSSCEDYSQFVEYLSYFQSWYQTVTPAPVSLYEDIKASGGLDVVTNLKTIMQPFEQRPLTPIGGNRLSPNGRAAYQELLTYAKTLQCVDFDQVLDTRYR